MKDINQFYNELLKLDEKELKETLKNAVLVAEEKWINTGISKGIGADESYIITRDDMKNLDNFKEKIYQNSSNSEELRVFFYEMKDTDKIAEDILNKNIRNSERLEQNFYGNSFKKLDINVVKKEKELEKLFYFFNENIDNLNSKGITVNIQFTQNNKSDETYILNAYNRETSRGELRISEKNIYTFLDKAVKYFAINDGDFNKYCPHFSSFQMDNEKLDRQTALENVMNSPKISSDLDNVILDTIIPYNSDISDMTIKFSTNDFDYGISLNLRKNNEYSNSLSLKKITPKEVASIVVDYDNVVSTFENNKSETRKNIIKMDFAIEIMINGLNQVIKKNEGSTYNLDINKKDNEIDYHLIVSDSNGKPLKEIQENNISNFVKETLVYIKKETGKAIDYNDYNRHFENEKDLLTNLEDLSDTKENKDYSINIKNNSKNLVMFGNINIEIPINLEKTYKTSDISTGYNDDVKDYVKEKIKTLLTKNNVTNDMVNDNENVYFKTDLIERQANNLIKKITPALENETWEDIRNNALAYSLSDEIIYGSFNVKINDVFKRIKETLIEVLENKIEHNKEDFLIKNADSLYLTVENGKIKEFGTTDPNADNIDIENTYNADVNRFVEELILTEGILLTRALDEKIPNNEDNFEFYEKSILIEKDFKKEISKIQKEHAEKSNNLIEKENEFLEKFFIAELKNQDKFMENYLKEGMTKQLFKETFNFDKFNLRLEEVGYHKISDEKVEKIANGIKINKLDVYFDKMCDERIKKLNKELDVEVAVDKQKELEK